MITFGPVDVWKVVSTDGYTDSLEAYASSEVTANEISVYKKLGGYGRVYRGETPSIVIYDTLQEYVSTTEKSKAESLLRKLTASEIDTLRKYFTSEK